MSPTLNEISKMQPEIIQDKSIEQLISLAGDGRLADGSKCSEELREFFGILSLEELSEHVENVLLKKKKQFKESGLVLQDMVNEIGRRLGFDVTNGLYQGTKNKPGHDGLWVSEEGTLLIEVKTTDAYRINLDTIAGYIPKLRETETDVDSHICILLVVGRQDTGDLEAQIRGSKHSFSARLISASALFVAAKLMEGIDDAETQKKIRQMLFPLEFTRLDALYSLLFVAAEEGERSAAASAETDVKDTAGVSSSVEEKREAIRLTLEKTHQISLDSVPRGRAKYSSGNKEFGFCIVVSKRYNREDQQYWYAFQNTWLEFMKGTKNSSLVLGCMDKNLFFLMSREKLFKVLSDLNKTEKPGRIYWHIALKEKDGEPKFYVSRTQKYLDLEKLKILTD